ncbi:hypothetical protein [Aureimonas sp. Leaf454]|uniref:hypothetical protein n=1 Tax=Aureimonas sp. Leaf454 TaxID=1736381 RepID=UPI0012E3C183|nr:hypothetical protein [Aureimonas sp. Leaf454]
MALAVLLAVAGGTPSAMAVQPDGWTAGPQADATMDKGRRFVCEGADCPAGGLACLHAVAPGAPGQGRTLRVHDMLRPKAFPWKDFEGWMRAKAPIVRPELAAASGTLAAAGPATGSRIGERDFMRRSYVAKAGAKQEAVEMAIWVTDNQLNAVICAVDAVDMPVSATRIEAFLGAMNVSPPAPPYDPLAQQ